MDVMEAKKSVVRNTDSRYNQIEDSNIKDNQNSLTATSDSENISITDIKDTQSKVNETPDPKKEETLKIKDVAPNVNANNEKIEVTDIDHTNTNTTLSENLSNEKITLEDIDITEANEPRQYKDSEENYIQEINNIDTTEPQTGKSPDNNEEDTQENKATEKDTTNSLKEGSDRPNATNDIDTIDTLNSVAETPDVTKKDTLEEIDLRGNPDSIINDTLDTNNTDTQRENTCITNTKSLDSIDDNPTNIQNSAVEDTDRQFIDIDIPQDNPKESTEVLNDNLQEKDIQIESSETNIHPDITVVGSDQANKTDNVVSTRKKRKTEIEYLCDVELKLENEDYDSFVDENDKIYYKKYKLRKKRKLDEPQETSETKEECVDYEQCPLCEELFNNLVSLRRHVRSMHEVNLTFTCSLCSQTFDTNDLLINHKKVHEHESHSYACHGCKVAYSNHCDILIHEISHSLKNSKHNCIECGLTYDREPYMTHILTHFEPRDTQTSVKEVKIPWQCPECGKITTRATYEKHMLDHTGVKPYQCVYCGKCLKTKQEKKIHMQRHTNDQTMYKCDVCVKTFQIKIHLTRHRDRHKNDKRLQCDTCDKRFIHFESLVSHCGEHNGREVYNCVVCGSGYVSFYSLKFHMFTDHSSVLPIECEPCDTSFYMKSLFVEHCLSFQHKINVFKSKKSKEK